MLFKVYVFADVQEILVRKLNNSTERWNILRRESVVHVSADNLKVSLFLAIL